MNSNDNATDAKVITVDFNNKPIRLPKKKSEQSIDEFKAIEQRNKANETRLAKERSKNNRTVLKDYKITEK